MIKSPLNSASRNLHISSIGREFPAYDICFFHCFIYVIYRCSGSFSKNKSNKVANGPSSSDIRNQLNPLLFLPCASPALIRASVPQPTKYVFSISINLLAITNFAFLIYYYFFNSIEESFNSLHE
jgi:hypothetical protein